MEPIPCPGVTQPLLPALRMDKTFVTCVGDAVLTFRKIGLALVDAVYIIFRIGLSAGMSMVNLESEFGLPSSCLVIYMDQFGLRVCMVNSVAKLGLSRFLEISVAAIGRCRMVLFMNKIGHSICMEIFVATIGQCKMVLYMNKIGHSNRMEIFMAAIGLLALALVERTYIHVVLKMLALILEMVWGEEDMEMDVGRVVSQCPGRKMQAPP